MLSFLQESFARAPFTTGFVVTASVMTVATLIHLLVSMLRAQALQPWHWWALVVFLGYSLFGGYQVRREYRYWSGDVRCQLQRKKVEHMRGSKRYWFWCRQKGKKRVLPVTKAEYRRCYPGYRLQKSKRSFRLHCAGWVRR